MPNTNDHDEIPKMPAGSSVALDSADSPADERAWTEALFGIQIQVLEEVARGKPLKETLDFSLRLCERQSADMLCSVLMLDPDGVTLRHGAAPSLPDEYIRAIDGEKIGPDAGSCGTAVYRKEPVVVEDTETDPLWSGYRDLARKFGLRACWSTPIFDTHRNVLGSFAVYFRAPGRPSGRHLLLIDIIAHLTSIAVMRERTEAALRLSEARHRRLIESNIIGVVIAGLHGRVKEANEFFLNLTGRTHEELKAGLLVSADMTPPGWEAVNRRAIQELVATGICAPFEKELWHRNGGRIPIRTVVALLDGPEGDCICLVEDLTEQKQAEERLRQTEKMSALGQLAGGVAHDFNNQLGIILGYAQLLYARLNDGELKRFAEPIIVAAKRSGDLTKNLLAFSRQGDFEKIRVDFHDMIEEILELLERTLDKRIALKRIFTANHPVVLGDPARLQNALLNLALNARDAMPEGGSLILSTEEVEIPERAGSRGNGVPLELPPGHYLLASVADTGLGMTEETKSRVFEHFFTTKPLGLGTGLGLASVYGTMQIHGGAVTVESKPGKGSVFHLFLPLAESRAPDSESPAEPPLKGLRILVVDDEPEIREVLDKLLAIEGHSVIKAEGGRQALAMYEDGWRDIDMVILDMVMADMSGFDVFHALRKINPSAKVLLSSGYGTEGKLQALLASGAVGLLQKPYLKAQLDDQIAKALAKGR